MRLKNQINFQLRIFFPHTNWIAEPRKKMRATIKEWAFWTFFTHDLTLYKREYVGIHVYIRSCGRNDIIYSFRPRKSGTFEYDKRDGDEISGFYFIYFLSIHIILYIYICIYLYVYYILFALCSLLVITISVYNIYMYTYIKAFFFKKHIFSLIHTHTHFERYIPSYLREWLLYNEREWWGGKGWFQWKRTPTRRHLDSFADIVLHLPKSQTPKILYGTHGTNIFKMYI